jgi:hypothetical protein
MKSLNKNTDNYILADWLDWTKTITEYTALNTLGIKNLSARISELRQMGFPIDSILKKVTKKSTGKQIKVRDYYCIRKGKVGKYRKLYKELNKC